MPSVGMRRSTRVFGTRVLRSGRRLWMQPQKGSKSIRAVHGENKWPDVGIIGNSADGGGVDANDRCEDMLQENENRPSMDMDVEPKIGECASEGAVHMRNVDTMCGIVYSRKRKRKVVELDNTGLAEDKRYGKKFARERWRKRFRAIVSFETREEDGVSGFRELAIIVDESSFDCGCCVTLLLASVLSYMSRVRIGMKRLSAFMRSKPIVDVYSSRGVLFLRDSITAKNPGVCIISESRSLVPLVCVDISSIPSFFALIQSRMYIRSVYMPFFLVASLLRVYKNDEKLSDVAVDADDVCTVQVSQLSPEIDTFNSDDMAVYGNDNSNWTEFIPPPIGITKLSLRSMQLRNSRKKIQKRRSSLRRKRGRSTSTFRAQKDSGALASEFVRIRDEGIQLSPAKSNHVLRSLANRTLSPIIKEPDPVSTQDVRVRSRCYANLLITEPDKCYREETAAITLELSSSKRWFLAIMKDGRTRYSITAQKVMRPSCSNRFTHATLWAGDGGWKLEFLNKQDWLIFKELYKECFERNMESAQDSVIPVPGVQEVLCGADSNYVPFVRPNSYITVRGDELTRALVKKTANYDMDSEDEMWLNKLNNELYVGREDEEVITPDSFELIIDALEKGFHCNPDENFDEQAAYDFCMHLERREVVEAVRNYWIKKRKQKRSALVRIFQLYQPRRIQVIPKSVLRKKRSFKRQASQGGRGKQRPFLKAIEAERNALEQQNNVHKLQEAKSAADRSEGFAILKRQKAQMLMENADLAAYKAVLAFRIAESAQLAEAPQTVASFFLG